MNFNIVSGKIIDVEKAEESLSDEVFKDVSLALNAKAAYVFKYYKDCTNSQEASIQNFYKFMQWHNEDILISFINNCLYGKHDARDLSRELLTSVIIQLELEAWREQMSEEGRL